MSTVNNGPQIVRNGLVLNLDAGYMRSYSPNVHPNPTNIFAWSGTGNNNCTLSGDISVSRQYGSIPLKMVMTGTDPYTGTYNVSTWNLAPAANGQTWTLSFYAKASETVTGNCFIFGANSSGNYIEAPSTSFTVTSSWQRFTFTTTFANASTAFIQIRFGGASGQVGKIIWWDGVQVERASSATTFNPFYIGNTNWRDAGGSTSITTLVGGPLFDSANKGNIYFDGGTAYCGISPANNFAWTPSSIGLNNMTIDLWLKTSDSTNGQYILSKPWNSSGEYNYFIYHNGFNINIGNQSNSFSFTSVATGNWVNLVILVSVSQFGAYLNGAQMVALTNHGITNNSPTSGNLQELLTLMTLYPYGGGANPTFSVLGNVSSLRIYNRVLSATEIAQNYETDKTRFGL